MAKCGLQPMFSHSKVGYIRLQSIRFSRQNWPLGQLKLESSHKMLSAIWCQICNRGRCVNSIVTNSSQPVCQNWAYRRFSLYPSIRWSATQIYIRHLCCNQCMFAKKDGLISFWRRFQGQDWLMVVCDPLFHILTI